jgi:hypothetical protein
VKSLLDLRREGFDFRGSAGKKFLGSALLAFQFSVAAKERLGLALSVDY